MSYIIKSRRSSDEIMLYFGFTIHVLSILTALIIRAASLLG